jgi:hypothetical protein
MDSGVVTAFARDQPPVRVPRIVPNPCRGRGLGRTGWVQPVAPEGPPGGTTPEPILSLDGFRRVRETHQSLEPRQDGAFHAPYETSGDDHEPGGRLARSTIKRFGGFSARVARSSKGGERGEAHPTHASRNHSMPGYDSFLFASGGASAGPVTHHLIPGRCHPGRDDWALRVTQR